MGSRWVLCYQLQGAAALIDDPALLTAAAGILAVEAYHAGAEPGSQCTQCHARVRNATSCCMPLHSHRVVMRSC